MRAIGTVSAVQRPRRSFTASDKPVNASFEILVWTPPGQRQFVDLARYAEYYQGKFQMTDAELAEFMETRTRDSMPSHNRSMAAAPKSSFNDRSSTPRSLSSPFSPG